MKRAASAPFAGDTPEVCLIGPVMSAGVASGGSTPCAYPQFLSGYFPPCSTGQPMIGETDGLAFGPPVPERRCDELRPHQHFDGARFEC